VIGVLLPGRLAARALRPHRPPPPLGTDASPVDRSSVLEKWRRGEAPHRLCVPFATERSPHWLLRIGHWDANSACPALNFANNLED